MKIEEGVPGGMVRYIAHFERENVESANIAFWFGPGRLGDLVTYDGKPNGRWWFFTFYGDMQGEMLMTTRKPDVPLDLDGVGSIDESEHTAFSMLIPTVRRWIS